MKHESAWIRIFGWLVFIFAASPAFAEEERCSLWVDLYFGEPVSFEEMIEEIAGADVVFLGETHRVSRHHEWQTMIIRALASEERPLLLGIEQMEAHYQPELDRYAAGEIGFDTLADRTGWALRWSNYEDYRPTLEAARAAGGVIVGLNARAETIRAIGRGGMEALDDEQRSELPQEMNFDDPLYEGLLNRKMMVHATFDEGMLRRVFKAQAARDEMMAHRLAVALREREGALAVVICGSGHCEFGLGMPDRVERRLPGMKQRIILFSESGDLELTEAERSMMRDIRISHEELRAIGRPLADYLQVTEPR